MLRSHTLHPSSGGDKCRLHRRRDIYLPVMDSFVNPRYGNDIHFFVQLVYGGWRNFRIPDGLGDIFHPTNRQARQIHLDKCFFHAALPAAIPFNDCGLKGNPFQPRHIQRDIAGDCCEVPVIVASAVALAASFRSYRAALVSTWTIPAPATH